MRDRYGALNQDILWKLFHAAEKQVPRDLWKFEHGWVALCATIGGNWGGAIWGIPA